MGNGKRPRKIGKLMRSAKPEFDNPAQKVRYEIAIKREKGKLFLERYKKLEIEERAGVVLSQVRGITKTQETVSLFGRVKISDDPKTFMFLMESFYRDYGLATVDAVRHADEIIGEFPEMTIQDMALFFKKFKFGSYGKLYGKISFGKLMEYFDNFQKSVGYNLELERCRVHEAVKEHESHRDSDWRENGRPEDLE